MVDTRRYREPGALQHAAEDILRELRDCPPAAGFDKVQVPGERESTARAANVALKLPAKTWADLCKTAAGSSEGQI